MSEKITTRANKKKTKESQPSANLVNNFINKARDSTENESGEPSTKKLKKSNSIEIKEKKKIPSKEKPTSNEDEDLDDSLKFFKVATTNFKKCNKATNSSEASTSTVVSSFINESKPKTKTAETKTRKPAAKKTTKKSKTQPDIRKAISKREQLFNHVLTENCQQDGLDPDEVQMALAISESMMDQSGPSTSDTSKFDNPFNSGNGKVQSITTVLERYGFKCKKNYTEYELGMITNTKLTTKKSRFIKVPTELTRTTADKRDEMIRLRVMDIMDENQSQKVDEVFDKFNYIVSSSFLQEFHEQVNTTFKISTDDLPIDDTLLYYYVQHLFEPSYVKADHLLKDWKKVPGRESTPDKDLPRELCGVTQASSQSETVEMFQVIADVRSEEPDEVIPETVGQDIPDTVDQVIPDTVVQEQEVSTLVETNQTPLPVISEPQDVVEDSYQKKAEEKAKKIERLVLTRSCSDLFADTSDVGNCSDFDEFDEVCEIPSDECSEELKVILAIQLQSLHTKLSISVVGSQIEETLNEVKEVVEIQKTSMINDTIDELEANLMEFEEDVSLVVEDVSLVEEDVSLVEDNCVDLTQMEVSKRIFENTRIDLTHIESADETETTIPIDDSFISLQAHIKKLEAQEKASRERKLEQQRLNCSDDTSIIKIDLLSSDEEDPPIKETIVVSSSEVVRENEAGSSQNIDEDLFEDPEELKFISNLQEEDDFNMNTIVVSSSEGAAVKENEAGNIEDSFKDPEELQFLNTTNSQIEDDVIMDTVVVSSSEVAAVAENVAGNIEEDLFEDPEELNFASTNNSQMEDEEVTIISDEEINYSIKKFYSYKEYQASQESQESQESEIIPPAAPNENEDYFELENWRDDVFGDSMTLENNFDINDSVMGLLETSIVPQVINKKDHSTRFHDSEILSDSIREILKKYQEPKVTEVSSRSLRKMQSETNLLNKSKQRKSVHFNFNDDFNDSINNPLAVLEDSFTWRLNNSVHEPLEDSIEDTPCSPVAIPTKTKPNAKKSAPKISLGSSKDNDYIIDTSRKYPDPDFHSMTPVELKQHLFKIGVRPLPVKKAIELLEYIYEQLHPQIRIAADEEIDVNDSRLLMNATDIVTNINVLDSDDFVFTPGLVEDEDYVLPKMRKTKVDFFNFLFIVTFSLNLKLHRFQHAKFLCTSAFIIWSVPMRSFRSTFLNIVPLNWIKLTNISVNLE